MSPRLMGGPLLLLLWQVAPVGVKPDSAGRYRITVGFGTGQWEEQSCDRPPVPHEYRFAGGQIDAWPSTGIRVSGIGGALSYSGGRTFAVVGGVAAVEGQYFGIGGGVMTSGWADPNGDTRVPSIYLRAGNRDRLHFRFDMLAPSTTMPTTGVMRAGLGFNQGLLRGAAGFVGLGFTSFQPGLGPFAEISLPFGSALDLNASGSWRPSAQYADWGLSLGARYTFGR